jgi:hypothetical protein
MRRPNLELFMTKLKYESTSVIKGSVAEQVGENDWLLLFIRVGYTRELGRRVVRDSHRTLA